MLIKKLENGTRSLFFYMEYIDYNQGYKKHVINNFEMTVYNTANVLENLT